MQFIAWFTGGLSIFIFILLIDQRWKHNNPEGGFWYRGLRNWEERYRSQNGVDVSTDGVDIPQFLKSWYFLPKYILLSGTYSYNNKNLSLLNASYLLNAPAWTHKVKRRPWSVRVFMMSFTVNCIHVYTSSAHFPSACGLWATCQAPP